MTRQTCYRHSRRVCPARRLLSSCGWTRSNRRVGSLCWGGGGCAKRGGDCDLVAIMRLIGWWGVLFGNGQTSGRRGIGLAIGRIRGRSNDDPSVLRCETWPVICGCHTPRPIGRFWLACGAYAGFIGQRPRLSSRIDDIHCIVSLRQTSIGNVERTAKLPLQSLFDHVFIGQNGISGCRCLSAQYEHTFFGRIQRIDANRCRA